MDGKAVLTPRGRSSRNRRPPKQFGDALSWEKVSALSRRGEREGGEDEGGEGVDAQDIEDEAGDDSDAAMVDDNEDLEGMSVDGDEGNSSDEFLPDASNPRHGKRKGIDRLRRLADDDFGSDSGEEFGLSPEEEPDDAELHASKDVDRPRNMYHVELTTSQRLNRAKKRMWVPPPGHGGLENPSDWREAGQRNRQMQTREHSDADGDVELEGDELQ